ncbi:hypothetical protein Q9966_000444 [Columba livia]|nr:hypothetical protein Q9966_000444 [Columba livia]
MAAAALRAAKGLRLVAGASSLAFTRSAFVARKPNYAQPNWFGVGLAFSTSAALWALVDSMLSKKQRHHQLSCR